MLRKISVAGFFCFQGNNLLILFVNDRIKLKFRKRELRKIKKYKKNKTECILDGTYK